MLGMKFVKNILEVDVSDTLFDIKFKAFFDLQMEQLNKLIEKQF